MYVFIYVAQSLPGILVHPADAVVREGATHVLHCTAAAISGF